MKKLIAGIGIAQATKKQCSMNKTTKLRYQYSDEPMNILTVMDGDRT